MSIPIGLRKNETVRSVCSRSRGMFYLIVAVTIFPGFLMGLDAELFNTAAPYIVRQADSTVNMLGILATGYSAGIALFSLVGGYLFSKFSAKYTLLASVALFSVFTFISGITHSEILLIISRLLVGIGVGMFLPTIVAFLGDIFTGKRARTMSIYIVVYSIGLFVGPYMVYPFLPHVEIPFILTMLVSIISMLLFYLIVPKTYKSVETQPVFQGIKQLFNRNTVMISICMFFYGIAFWGLNAYKAEYLLNILNDDASTAIIISVTGISGIIVTFPLGILADKLDRKYSVQLIGLCVAVGVIGFFAIGSVPTVIGLSIFMFLFGVGSAFPGFASALIQDSVKEHLVGVATGWIYFICNIGGIFGGPIFSLFIPLGYIQAGLISLGISSLIAFAASMLTISGKQAGQKEITAQDLHRSNV